MNGVCASNAIRVDFGQPEITDFALVHELSHGSDRLFYRRLGIGTGLIIQIDAIHTEASKTFLAGLLHVRRLATHAAEARIACIA